MKNSILDRILVFIYAVLTMALTALAALRMLGIDILKNLYESITAQMPGNILPSAVMIGLAAMIVLLGAYVIKVITPSRRKKSKFIVVKTGESGEVSLAVSAIKDMVKQSAANIGGILDMEVKAEGGADDVAIAVGLKLAHNVNVPAVTARVQRGVKEYLENKCGVMVSDVSVVVSEIEASPEIAYPVAEEPETQPEVPDSIVTETEPETPEIEIFTETVFSEEPVSFEMESDEENTDQTEDK